MALHIMHNTVEFNVKKACTACTADVPVIKWSCLHSVSTIVLGSVLETSETAAQESVLIPNEHIKFSSISLWHCTWSFVRNISSLCLAAFTAFHQPPFAKATHLRHSWWVFSSCQPQGATMSPFRTKNFLCFQTVFLVLPYKSMSSNWLLYVFAAYLQLSRKCVTEDLNFMSCEFVFQDPPK